MGNQKFKLSDMLPNAWFVKLKYMGTKTAKTKHHHHHSSSPSLSTPNKKHSISATKSKPVGASVAAEVQQQPYLSHARKSYHFTREHNNDPRSKMSDSYNNNHLIPDPPRKSAKRRSTKRKSTPTTVTTTRYSPSSSCSSPSTTKVVNSSASSGCSSRAVDAFRPKSNSHPPPPSPINDVPYLPESDHLSILPQFSPPDHVLLSSGSKTLHPTGGGGRACSSATCTCKLDSSSAAATDDVVIDVDEKSLAKRDGKTVVDDGIDSISRLVELRPILTKKPTAFNHLKTRGSVDESSVEYKRTSNLTGRRENDDKSSLSSLKFTQGEEENDRNFKGRHDENNNRNKIRTPMRRFVVSSPGVGVGLRLRLSSPRIGRKLSAGGSATGNGTGRKSLSSGGSRKSISESFAIVKSSFDPQKDFRESMVEMIVQNNIKDTKELEELLAAYLSLNSDEYHGVIINVFKQIWFDLNHIRQRQRKAVDRRSVVAGNY